MVSDTRHNSEPILGRNNSLLGCLDLARVYRYYFCTKETCQHVPVQWQLGKTVMSELLHVLKPSFERGLHGVKATTPPTGVPSALTTRPWPTRQDGLALAVWYPHNHNLPALQNARSIKRQCLKNELRCGTSNDLQDDNCNRQELTHLFLLTMQHYACADEGTPVSGRSTDSPFFPVCSPFPALRPAGDMAPQTQHRWDTGLNHAEMSCHDIWWWFMTCSFGHELRFNFKN